MLNYNQRSSAMTTHEILLAAQAAKLPLALADTDTKNAALEAMAVALVENSDAILAANKQDLAAARGRISDVMLDRLALTPARLAAMAKGMREVAALPDPVGAVLRKIVRPNGLLIEKTSVPMGVIAIIYESRPNVTSDAAALALKAGSACVLRCGRDAWASCHAIVNALRCGLARAGLPESAVSLIEDTTHASANELMTANGLVDLLIPRGGAGLIRACVENATVPCIQTGTGICHVYVDKAADLNMAVDIIENAKTSRPSVCNAEEVCLVHKDVATGFLPLLKARLVDARAAAGLVPVDLRLDERAAAIIPGTPAGEQDFDTEFLNYILAIAVVDDVDAAIAHIARHSTHHSEAIITADDTAADRFTTCVDSAAVYVNASTRFTDGGEFGLGCEMGISTQKLHARGPMGLAELCSYKYIIHGSGQTRGGSAAKLQNPCN
ncbi:MAG TPA: glutamate-5-semialdehyde dehydrogenase [Gemmiger qucibialis]|nr:glutamate-5-semialdehyde dehydrogenase [Gemmiger qucibialis]